MDPSVFLVHLRNNGLQRERRAGLSPANPDCQQQKLEICSARDLSRCECKRGKKRPERGKKKQYDVTLRET